MCLNWSKKIQQLKEFFRPENTLCLPLTTHIKDHSLFQLGILKSLFTYNISRDIFGPAGDTSFVYVCKYRRNVIPSDILFMASSRENTGEIFLPLKYFFYANLGEPVFRKATATNQQRHLLNQKKYQSSS